MGDRGVSYPRSLAGTGVVCRWCVIGEGEEQTGPPWGVYAQTYWGLSRLAEAVFPAFDEAVAFVDEELLTTRAGGPQWLVAGSGEARGEGPYALHLFTARGRYRLSAPEFERQEHAEEFLLREIVPLGRLDSAG